MSDVGRVWPSECSEYADARTGARVRQLTNHRAHSHHLYFTNPGWYAAGRRLLISSDRGNRTNLYGLDLASGEIEQLTDLEPLARPYEVVFLRACVNPKRDEAYYTYGREVCALDLATKESRVIGEIPEGFRPSMSNCTADGTSLCLGTFEILGDVSRTDLLRGYVGFRETFEAKPLSKIIRYATDGSGTEVVHEDKTWIGHVNTSPTKPVLLTFCHEGPWDLVDNRIWCLDIESQKAWRVRPREQGEKVGHEYWYADGERIGYHGARPDGTGLFGRIRYDNSDRVEGTFSTQTGHIHSNDESLVVGDRGVVRVWKWTGDGYDGPRVLCEHRSSFHIQQVHVHPRFSPDGSYVLFTSDRTGYGNVYAVDVPEFESLPPAD